MKMMGWRQKLSIVAPYVPLLDNLVFGELNDGISVVHIALVDAINVYRLIAADPPTIDGLLADDVDSHLHAAVALDNSLSNPRAYVRARVRLFGYRLSAERARFKLHLRSLSSRHMQPPP